MGSISSPNPATFTGNSSFSTQLSAVISNAVTMASQPIVQLQKQQDTLTSQQTELQSLSNNFQSLQSALDSIDNAVGIGSYSASFSNSSVGTASIGSGVMSGSYTVDVISLGSQTNTMSAAGGGSGTTTVTDPTSQNIDSSQNYTLTVNGTTYNISGASTLDQLAQAINTSGANLQATVVNVGGSGSPDYRLSVQSLNYAPDTIQLSDSGSNTTLLNSITTGSSVQYQVNGQSSTLTSNSRTISLSTGLSITFQGVGSTTINVGQSVSGVGNALSSFVSAYNSAVDALATNRGKNGGALSGQAIVYQLTNTLQTITKYMGSSGSVTSLASLGVTFDQTGHLSFDSSTFNQLAWSSPSSIMNFLGSETVGGFLQTASTALKSAADPITGVLAQASDSLATEVTDISTQIANNQTRVAQLQSTLTSQMAAADAAIASLEGQVGQLTTLFTDMQNYTYGANH